MTGADGAHRPRTRPARRWAMGIGATALLAVIALVVGIGIRDAREATPPAVASPGTSSPAPTPSTSDPTPTAISSPSAISGDRESIADEESCRAVLDGDADAQTWIESFEFVANYPDIKKDEVDNGVYPFIHSGGLVCAWSAPSAMEISGVMASGAISAAEATSRMAALDAEGIDSHPEDGWIRYDERDGYPGGYAFGDGFWVWVFVNAMPGTDEPDFLADIVANQDRIRPALDPGATGGATADDPDAAATPADPPYLTSEGLGTLRIGQRIPADNGYVTWNGNACFDGVGAWIPPDSTIVSDGINKWGFIAQPDPPTRRTGALARIAVTDATIPTKSGVRVGDSMKRLLATYPSFDHTVQRDGYTLYAIDGSTGRVVFEVVTDPDLYSSGRGSFEINTVAAIGVYARDTDLKTVNPPDGWTPCVE